MSELRKDKKIREREESAKRLEKFKAKMQSSLIEMSKTKGGINILRYLMHESGYHQRNIAITEKGICEKTLIWNDARREFYLDVRQFMTTDVIRLVEFGDTAQAKEEEVL